MTDQLAVIRDTALSVLQDVLEWDNLTPARWDDVARILDRLGTGLDLTDPDQLAALSEATIALELAAPIRIITIETAGAPVPDRVRERANRLIHELTRIAFDETEPGSGPGH
jgi:hypothetical protein